MTDAPLRATQAARELGMSTKDLLRLIHRREIGFVMKDGIAPVPREVVEEYQAGSA